MTDVPTFDPEREVLLGPQLLRSLAHPLRARLRAELAERRPATATQLAAQLGESSGATSYHLRQLEAVGLVADEPSLGNGRERYWRAVHRASWFDMSVPAVGPGLAADYMRAVAQVYAERLVRLGDSIEAAADEVRRGAAAVNMSDWLLDLTLPEAQALQRRFAELCAPYRHDDDRPRPGARRVVVQYQVLPTGPRKAREHLQPTPHDGPPRRSGDLHPGYGMTFLAGPWLVLTTTGSAAHRVGGLS